MSKIDEAKEILNALQVPAKQQNTMCCCVLLAMAGLVEETPWQDATNEWIRIHDVIAFANNSYGTTYAENSRETFRKQAMHHFRNAAFIEDNGKATNSPNYRYRLTDEMLKLVQSFGTDRWETKLTSFQTNHDTLVQLYASKRVRRKMPVKINGEDFTFSPGDHNQLQKAIIEEFAPRFAPNSECLYVGDTIEKDLVKNEDKLSELGFTITLYDIPVQKIQQMFLGLRAGHAAVMAVGNIACQRASQEELADSAAIFDAIISQTVMIMTLKQTASGSIGGRWVGLQSIRPDTAAEQSRLAIGGKFFTGHALSGAALQDPASFQVNSLALEFFGAAEEFPGGEGAYGLCIIAGGPGRKLFDGDNLRRGFFPPHLIKAHIIPGELTYIAAGKALLLQKNSGCSKIVNIGLRNHLIQATFLLFGKRILLLRFFLLGFDIALLVGWTPRQEGGKRIFTGVDTTIPAVFPKLFGKAENRSPSFLGQFFIGSGKSLLGNSVHGVSVQQTSQLFQFTLAAAQGFLRGMRFFFPLFQENIRINLNGPGNGHFAGIKVIVYIGQGGGVLYRQLFRFLHDLFFNHFFIRGIEIKVGLSRERFCRRFTAIGFQAVLYFATCGSFLL
ncbi:hypothetical protein B5G06_13650 [Flavonifractor sp. An52]|uniref:BsuBI/PstI family type II restriction endonuclease n=1 Tax=Flavonifractor sp. An52 TaxID=1965642 RepID=UPI000B3A3D65|nr:BsuBI/PstI family type II restriction endonuclease [Flavonifractor sp. An52]OUN76223.1 hypothetical protein B5G06_13650 [Flavonifractor sp. An52]